ncbi:MAG: anthranilate phosphoribosyltransferase [Myxococcales bacterium]|nr:anthranilate phosphoribosyltransferase [Myxococcales bacterium]USN51700.1 MAG: anthranilate phosphoribosyltransferase [Myxococcales bacterium]
MNEKILLNELMSLKDLSVEQVGLLIDDILEERMPASQVAAALALLSAKGESGQEIAIAAQTVLKKTLLVEQPDYLFGDVVGTGGDGFNTINVSTLASLVAATAGFPVAKHGSVSVSSRCGSADILRALGIDIMQGPKEVRQSLDKNKWCFLFAPNYHRSFKAVKDIRRELGIKTIFNILGPLVNPLRPPIMLIGVYDPKLLEHFAVALKDMGRKTALIVHGGGLDELAVHSVSDAVLLKDNKVEKLSIHPDDLGLKSFALEQIQGGGVEENIQISIDLLSGHADEAKSSIVAASAGALLWLAGKESSLKSGVGLALEIIKSGQTMKLIKELQEQAYGA